MPTQHGCGVGLFYGLGTLVGQLFLLTLSLTPQNWYQEPYIGHERLALE